MDQKIINSINSPNPHYSEPIKALSDISVTTCQAYPTALPSSSGGSNETNSTDILAMDCEFVHFYDPESRKHIGRYGLAQVAIVNYDGHVVYDKYVHPDEPEYLWNNSRKRDFLKNSNSTFAEVQAEVIQIIKGKTLVGFALINDMLVLKIKHPYQLIRDVSFCQKCLDTDGRPYGLKDMALKLLNITIHVNGSDHEGVQDATVTMDVFKILQNYSEQMIPPPDFYLKFKNVDFIPTTPICAPPPEAYIAINCMVVLVGPDFNKDRAVGQATFVNYSGDIILDEYIWPVKEVTDFLTNISGITKEIMDEKGKSINFTDAREIILKIIENKIIIDIDHLRLRNTQNLPPYLKHSESLAKMAKEQLNMDVTNDGKPSSPNRALANMKLYQKYEAEGNKMIPKRRKSKKTTSSLLSTISILPTPFLTRTTLTQFNTQASTACILCTTGTSMTMDRFRCCNIL
ncbi:46099_t:CDS:10 [Gigaspora margarita]|uniref:46099_t:CDS:1 n=1 Tax=Gigaspora margarita TaxID=4874 RepID=A0ABN7VKW1_GIGMA|nr:46099_t:CDS:10 [Gigaspora margarita]